jgi:glycosyltransferase involved in cell wall biosynthesis
MTDNNKQPLRVGYVLKRFPRFSETFILNEILALERRGVEVLVFSLMRPPEEPRHHYLEQLQARVIYLPGTRDTARICLGDAVGGAKPAGIRLESVLPRGSEPLPGLLAGKSPVEATHLVQQAGVLASLAAVAGVEHLHAHFASNATLVSLLASRISGIPFSFTAHARDIYHTYTDKQTDDTIRAARIREAAFVATVSDYNRRHLQELVSRNHRCDIRRLYNGIDQSRFNGGKKQGTHDPFRFVGVGRLVEKKGFGYLVDACFQLRDLDLRFQCRIIGDGPERHDLQERIDRFDLGDWVEILEPQPQEQLVGTLEDADAMVLPCVVAKSGDRDGLPTVLLEAMAMGLPLISTEVAGVPEIIEHGKTGYVVPPENASLLAAVMQSMIRFPDKTLRMGRLGRARGESMFNLDTNAGILGDWFAESARGATTGLASVGAC